MSSRASHKGLIMLCAAAILLLGLECSAAAVPQPAPPTPEQRAAEAIQKNLGVEFAVAESKIRRSIIRTTTPYGFKIKAIAANSKAARAGWQVGDILLEWNAVPIKNLTDLDEGLKKSAAAESADYKLSRYKKNQPLRARQPWEEISGKIKLKS